MRAASRSASTCRRPILWLHSTGRSSSRFSDDHPGQGRAQRARQDQGSTATVVTTGAAAAAAAANTDPTKMTDLSWRSRTAIRSRYPATWYQQPRRRPLTPNNKITPAAGKIAPWAAVRQRCTALGRLQRHPGAGIGRGWQPMRCCRVAG
jgi:hypothetical protein